MVVKNPETGHRFFMTLYGNGNEMFSRNKLLNLTTYFNLKDEVLSVSETKEYMDYRKLKNPENEVSNILYLIEIDKNNHLKFYGESESFPEFNILTVLTAGGKIELSEEISDGKNIFLSLMDFSTDNDIKILENIINDLNKKMPQYDLNSFMTMSLQSFPWSKNDKKYYTVNFEQLKQYVQMYNNIANIKTLVDNGFGFLIPGIMTESKTNRQRITSRLNSFLNNVKSSKITKAQQKVLSEKDYSKCYLLLEMFFKEGMTASDVGLFEKCFDKITSNTLRMYCEFKNIISSNPLKASKCLKIIEKSIVFDNKGIISRINPEKILLILNGINELKGEEFTRKIAQEGKSLYELQELKAEIERQKSRDILVILKKEFSSVDYRKECSLPNRLTAAHGVLYLNKITNIKDLTSSELYALSISKYGRLNSHSIMFRVKDASDLRREVLLIIDIKKSEFYHVSVSDSENNLLQWPKDYMEVDKLITKRYLNYFHIRYLLRDVA